MRAKTAIIVVLLTALASLALISVARATGPSINLPTDPVTVRIVYPDPISYYAVILSDVPTEGDYHVTNGPYVGWCADEHHCIYTGTFYQAILYSSYDPECPHQTVQWDKINYILNHKQGTPIDVQTAIWYFAEGGQMPQSTTGQDIVNDAETNGQDFVPVSGQIAAVVVWINERTQVAIIEVIVPLDNVIPEYPLGPILGTVTFIAALAVFKYRHSIPKLF